MNFSRVEMLFENNPAIKKRTKTKREFEPLSFFLQRISQKYFAQNPKFI